MAGGGDSFGGERMAPAGSKGQGGSVAAGALDLTFLFVRHERGGRGWDGGGGAGGGLVAAVLYVRRVSGGNDHGRGAGIAS